jgi:hypothetical protein
MSAVSWCGQRISGGNSAASSRLQRSRYSASASCLTVQPVGHKYRAASRSLEITHRGSRADRINEVGHEALEAPEPGRAAVELTRL